MSRVIGLVNLHNSPQLGGLTANRPLASTSFLGRYAFIDFALSNFVNSGIEQLGVLVKDNLRSINKHLGSMKPWILNTKTGYGTIMFNESGAINPPYNHDINNIRTNDWVLFAHNVDYIIIQPAHIIMNLDLRPILEEHIKRDEKITCVYTKITDADDSFKKGIMVSLDKDNYVSSFSINKGINKEANISLETYIINKDVLRDLIDQGPKINALYGLNDLLCCIVNKEYRIHAYEYVGYARCFDSLVHYTKYCRELLDSKEKSAELFSSNWIHYTVTHDTPPTLYGIKCSIKNSFVANGAIISGTVENSVISRNVRVGKGALIKDSIILTDTVVGDNVTLKNVVVDKYCKIINQTVVEGSVDKPRYIKQGEKL